MLATLVQPAVLQSFFFSMGTIFIVIIVLLLVLLVLLVLLLLLLLNHAFRVYLLLIAL